MDPINSDSGDEPLVEQIAEEILERKRRGEQPSLEEYYQQYPDHEEDLRSFLPALLAVESLKPDSEDKSGSMGGALEVGGERRDYIGDYRIFREIGRGGMGVVYEAEQQALGRRVALKVVSRSATGSRKAVERFQSEARAAARMHHTNIVPVFDVGNDGEYLYYAMQLIQGQSVDLVIDDLKLMREQSQIDTGSFQEDPREKSVGSRKQGIAHSLVSGHFHQEQLIRSGQLPVPENEDDDQVEPTQIMGYHPDSTGSAVLPGKSDISSADKNREAYYHSVAAIGRQTASALAYAHARGIIHRDIKPSNLLLDGAGIVWITDFGLAKTGDQDLTHTGDILGTLRYMSPERFKGQCDVRADVYSLGLTMYELLTLTPAFESADRLKLIEMIADSEPPSLRAIDPRIPRDLETIILKAIDKDPRRRYQSADDMEEDLQRYLEDEPILARRVSSFEQLSRWGRRNKGLASALSVVAVLLMVLAIGSTMAANYFYDLSEENQGLAEANQREADKANKAREAAEILKDKANELAAGQLLDQATAARAKGDVPLALLLEAEALRRDHSVPVRAINHRRRIALDLRQCPRPVGILFHDEAIQDARISYNGKWFATAAGDTIHIWDLETGKEIKSRQFDGEVNSFVFTIDDERVLASVWIADVPTTTTDLSLWDWGHGKLVDLPVDYQSGFNNYYPYGNRYELMSVPTGNGEWTPFSLQNGEQIGPPLKPDGKIINWQHHKPLNDTTWLLYKVEEVLKETHGPEPGPPVANAPAAQSPPKRYFVGIWNLVTGENHILDRPALQFVSNYRTPKLHGCLTADGELLATTHDLGDRKTELVLHRTSTGERAASFHPVSPLSWIPWQFTHDNSALLCSSAAVASRDPEFLSVLDPESGALLQSPIRCAPNSSQLWSVSPTGRYVLVLNSERNPQVFNLHNDEDHYPPMEQTASVTQMCWSPDGRLIAVATSDGAMRVWDSATGQPRNAPCRHPGNIVRLEFTRDGSRVITAGGQEVRIWPVDPPEVKSILMAQEAVAAERTNAPGSIFNDSDKVQLNENGTRLFLRRSVSADAQPRQQPGAKLHARVEVWNTATRKMELARIFDVQTRVEFDSSFGMQVDATGERVLIYNYAIPENPIIPGYRVNPGVGTRDDSNSVTPACQFWDIKTDRIVSLQIPAAARALQTEFTDDPGVIRARYLKTTDHDESNVPLVAELAQQLFDSETGSPVGPGTSFELPLGTRYGVTSDGELLASYSTDDPKVVTVRNFRSGREMSRFTLPESETVWSLSFSRNNRVLVIKSRNQVIINSGKREGILRLIDLNDGTTLYETFDITFVTLLSIGKIFDDEATRLVLQHSAQDSRIEVYDVASKRSTFFPHEHSVIAVSISSDGRYLLTSTADRKVRCWDLKTGGLLHSLDGGGAQFDDEPIWLDHVIQFSSDNQRIIFGVRKKDLARRPLDAGLVQIWDVETGQPVASFWTQALASSVNTPSPDRFIAKTDNGYDLIDLSGETRPLQEIEDLAQALSRRKLNARGLPQPVPSEEFRALWEKTSPLIWAALVSPPTGHAWFEHEFAKLDLDNSDIYPTEFQNASSLWYVEQLIKADGRPAYHVARLILNHRLGNINFVLENEHGVIARIEADPLTPREEKQGLIRSTLDTVALIHAKQGQWPDASVKYEEAFRKTVDTNSRTMSVGQLTPLKYAAISALKSEEGRLRYETLCDEYLRLPKATRSPRESYTGIDESFLFLIPRSQDFWELFSKRAGDTVQTDRVVNPALVMLRSVDDSTTLDILNRSRSQTSNHPVSMMMVEAMTRFRLGHVKDARDIYERGLFIKNHPLGSSLANSRREFYSPEFMREVEADILQMEAEKLLNEPTSATPQRVPTAEE